MFSTFLFFSIVNAYAWDENKFMEVSCEQFPEENGRNQYDVYFVGSNHSIFLGNSTSLLIETKVPPGAVLAQINIDNTANNSFFVKGYPTYPGELCFANGCIGADKNLMSSPGRVAEVIYYGEPTSLNATYGYGEIITKSKSSYLAIYNPPSANAFYASGIVMSFTLTDESNKLYRQWKADGCPADKTYFLDCSANNLSACATQTTCEQFNGSWNGQTCSSKVVSTCGANNLSACANQATCEAVNGQWNGVACASPPTCSATNLNACTTQATCTAVSGYWNGSACSSPPTCSATNLSDCTTQATCENFNGHWDGLVCATATCCTCVDTTTAYPVSTNSDSGINFTLESLYTQQDSAHVLWLLDGTGTEITASSAVSDGKIMEWVIGLATSIDEEQIVGCHNAKDSQYSQYTSDGYIDTSEIRDSAFQCFSYSTSSNTPLNGKIRGETNDGEYYYIMMRSSDAKNSDTIRFRVNAPIHPIVLDLYEARLKLYEADKITLETANANLIEAHKTEISGLKDSLPVFAAGEANDGESAIFLDIPVLKLPSDSATDCKKIKLKYISMAGDEILFRIEPDENGNLLQDIQDLESCPQEVAQE